MDYTQVFYLTDTGRKWNHAGAGIRARVASGFDIPVKSTDHLVTPARQDRPPDKIMINTHPQRWDDWPLPWLKELTTLTHTTVIHLRLDYLLHALMFLPLAPLWGLGFPRHPLRLVMRRPTRFWKPRRSGGEHKVRPYRNRRVAP